MRPAAAATIILEDESQCQPLHHGSVHSAVAPPPPTQANIPANETNLRTQSQFVPPNLFAHPRQAVHRPYKNMKSQRQPKRSVHAVNVSLLKENHAHARNTQTHAEINSNTSRAFVDPHHTGH